MKIQKSTQLKIKNFNNYKFEIENVIRCVGYESEEIVSLLIEITAENLETKQVKIFVFQNGGKKIINTMEEYKNNDFNIYKNRCKNVDFSDHHYDYDLIKFLEDFLKSQNVYDFAITCYMNCKRENRDEAFAETSKAIAKLLFS